MLFGASERIGQCKLVAKNFWKGSQDLIETMQSLGELLSRDDGQENNRMYEMMSKSDMKSIIIERFSVSGLKI